MKNPGSGIRVVVVGFMTLAILISIGSIPGSAQSADYESLLRRMAQLEQRQAALEMENQALWEQLGSLLNDLSRREVAIPIQPAALATAPAPQAPAPRPAAPAEAPPQRVQLGGEIRFRPESRSSFNQSSNVNTVMLQRVRLDARLRLNENITGLIQVQDSRLWGQETSTLSNDSNLDLHQAYVQVGNLPAPPMSLRLGRQELSYGNQRLVGAVGWDNVGRSFDAAKLAYSAPRWSADLFFGRLVDRRNSGRGDGSQDLIGLYARIGRANSNVGLEPYLLYLRDGLEIAGEQPGSRRQPTRILTLGFRHFAAMRSGFAYDLENAYQVGQKGPDTQRAAALAAQARYRFGSRFTPEVGFEYDFATGDGNPQDGRSEEFNNLFPTNHIHYGFADYMGWRNMRDFKPYVAFQLRANLRAELSYHRLLLIERRGAWKNAGGAVLGLDPTGQLGTDVGHEFDITFTFPLYEHLRMLPGYSLFLPGSFARGTQGPRASQFAYWQTLVTF